MSKRHRGERNGRCKSNRRRHESGHEADRRMIDFREKIVFASGTRQCSGEFTVTERATECGNSTDDPEHQQRESRPNII